MAQFDVHRNLDPQSRGELPFVVDIQSDLLSHLGSRVVIPLVTAEAQSPPVSRLNPRVLVQGRQLLLDTAQIVGVPKSALGPVVANLMGSRDAVVAAVDVLIAGV